MSTIVQDLEFDATRLAIRNYDSYGLVCQLYVSNTINPYFICSGYSESEALETAYNTLNIFDKSMPFEQYLDDIKIISTITV